MSSFILLSVHPEDICQVLCIYIHILLTNVCQWVVQFHVQFFKDALFLPYLGPAANVKFEEHNLCIIQHQLELSISQKIKRNKI